MSNIPTDREQIEHELAELEARVRGLKASLGSKAPNPVPAKLRLTKSTVAALPIPQIKNKIYWDRALVGFGLRISPAGARTYFCQMRTRSGRGIKVTLGRANRITAEQARQKAKELLAAVDLGRDPAQELKDRRRAQRERRLAPTVSALWQDFEAKHLPGLRPKSATGYVSWWIRHIEPKLGRLKLADLSRARVEQLHREVATASGGVSANRVLATLSAMLTHAVALSLIPANVCKGVKRIPEPARERDLDDVELARLVTHLAVSADPEARVVELLLATGARKGEVLSMKWSDLNGGSWWTVPIAASKTKRTLRKPLNIAAVATLALVPRGTAEVFPSMTESRLSKWWIKTRTTLGLDGVHLHDLRHVSASLALNSGAPLSAVSSLLGHGVNSAGMTARYAHIGDRQLLDASKAIADRLALLKAEPAGRG
jgi:integrase